MKADFATYFKNENEGKFVWFNGAMGLETALLNDYLENTYENAVHAMANRDNVPYDVVEKNYNDWYYILPVEEVEDDALNDYGNKFYEQVEPGVWQMK